MSAPLHVDAEGPQINGELFVRAEQSVALLQRRLIKPMSRGGPRSELTLTQYHALSFLASRGKASVTELKDMLGFAQSTTSVLVEKLVRMGLVEKRRDRRDHRVACVVALPKGLRMVQRYRKNAERNLQILLEHLGEGAVRDVFDALERAVVATAPLENPTIVRAGLAAAEAEALAEGDGADDHADDHEGPAIEGAGDGLDDTLEAAE
jgi:DNA-binding MarR family transcriptional regulator